MSSFKYHVMHDITRVVECETSKTALIKLIKDIIIPQHKQHPPFSLIWVNILEKWFFKRRISIFIWHYRNNFNPFLPIFSFNPPENIRILKVFWCFQGDQRGTLGRKGLKEIGICCINIIINYLSTQLNINN